jgi:hypothetical protein
MQKRKNELTDLFAKARPGLVFVTAFPESKTYCRFCSSIAWEDSAAETEHQRTAEAVYAAHALQAAYRCGMFGELNNRPFVDWLMLVEDAPGSRSPVAECSPHFPVRPEFQNTSYLQRCDLLCRKLMQENLYTAASVITSPATAARNGKFAEVSELTGLKIMK